MTPRSSCRKIPDVLDSWQPAQCAHADDLAVAASSFRALAPAFHFVDHIAGVNSTIANAVGFSMVVKDLNPCEIGP